MTLRDNLFEGLPSSIPQELVQVIAENRHVRIERIVSQGHVSPEGFWYDQEEHEWVLLLTGAAVIRFEDSTVQLAPGDFLSIPAHRKHRVEWTAEDQPTVWLAVFYRD